MSEEARNPYAAPRAPLTADEAALRTIVKPTFQADVEYGGFWRRVGALLLDALIMTPIFSVTYLGVQYSKMFYVWSFIPSLLLGLFYSVWLVQKFGGTPGKRILGMRIALENGAAITPKAALLRYSVIGILTSIQSYGLLVATRNISDESYYGVAYLQKILALTAAAPSFYPWISALSRLWMVAVAVTMLCNYRRRALHDYIAGTVVLRERP